ncbi:MAG TPA: hypothetical protein VKU39_06650, partial [Streptosporangiaceae bacterium]|nr:hypothetical protein [Streptosporangiaceae bacterium]
LQSYFTAINEHDYSAYVSLLIPSIAHNESASAFSAGYSSTTDSAASLTAISTTESGVAATVTFTSNQQPSQSPDNSACDNWTITLYLAQAGSGYLIGTPPTSYSATHSPC